jgi:hypothetical protein
MDVKNVSHKQQAAANDLFTSKSSESSQAGKIFADLIKKSAGQMDSSSITTEVSQTLINTMDQAKTAQNQKRDDTDKRLENKRDDRARDKVETRDDDRDDAPRKDRVEDTSRDDTVDRKEDKPAQPSAKQESTQGDSFPQGDQQASPPDGQIGQEETPGAETITVAEAADNTTETAQVAVNPALSSDAKSSKTETKDQAATGVKAAQAGDSVDPDAKGPVDPNAKGPVDPNLAKTNQEAQKAAASTAQAAAQIAKPQTKDTTAQEQASQLAKTLDPDANVEVKVRTTNQAPQDAKTLQAQQATQQSQKTAATPDTTNQDTGAGSGGYNRNGTAFTGTQTPLQQAQASAQNANTSPGNANGGQSADAQAETAFEQQVMDQQSAAQMAARQGPQAKALPRAPTSQATQQGQAQAPQAAATQTTAQTAAQPKGEPIAQGVQTQTTQQTQSAQKAQEPQRPRQNPEAQKVLDQIKVNIGKALDRGLDRITVQLTPKALGKVEVKMEVAKDGKVHATVTADHKDTLETLRSDAKGLEQALKDAGLKADSGSLNFQLRGEANQFAQTGRGQGGQGRMGAGGPGDGAASDLEPDPNAIEAARANRATARGGLDISV